MKKVALYIPSMNGGGAQRVMVTLANGLAQEEIKVDLVLNQSTGPYMSDISDKVNVITLNTSRALTSIVPLSRYLRKEKPSTILSAMHYVNIITVVAKIISFTDVRVVLSEHNNLTASLNNNNRVVFNFIFLKLMSWAYKRSDAIVAVSDGVANDLSNRINICRDMITTIYNPIVTPELLKSINSSEPLDHPWFQNSTIPVIIAVGRLTSQKNFTLLINAFTKVINKIDANLFILGEGEMRSQLEDQIKHLNLQNKVELHGFVSNPYKWMSKSDLFVLSSKYEGFGNVLVEAMACGTPVISTNCPSGPSEILDNGKWGELVPINDIDTLSESIIRTLNNSNISTKNLVERAKKFSLNQAVKNYLKVLIP